MAVYEALPIRFAEKFAAEVYVNDPLCDVPWFSRIHLISPPSLIVCLPFDHATSSSKSKLFDG